MYRLVISIVELWGMCIFLILLTLSVVFLRDVLFSLSKYLLSLCAGSYRVQVGN